MELAFDSLSIALLSGIVVVSLVHLVLLRKPEPATHPLLLGRQSELNKVRKPSESPAFVSSSAGLGGTAKQQLKDVKLVQDIWLSRGGKVVMGADSAALDLGNAVRALCSHFVQGGEGKEPITVKLEDPGDALLAALAASQVADRSSSASDPSPILQSTSTPLSIQARSSLVLTSMDLPANKDGIATLDPRRLYLLNATQQMPLADPAKFVPKTWTTTTIFTETLAGHVDYTTPQDGREASETVVRMDTAAGKSISITHKHLLHGGIVSILNMFPLQDKPSPQDRILSFESTATPYGFAAALAAASTGATLRFCSPQRGITSKCRAFKPSIVFCTPNELNAIRTSLEKQLSSGTAALSFGLSAKLSLLRAGNTSHSTFWDKMVFDGVRTATFGSHLRCIICSTDGSTGPTHDTVEFLRIVLGIPIVVALTHPLVAGPISNTLYHDYQRFTASPSDASHVGCPSATIECKLIDVDEAAAQEGVYRGKLVIQGPSVLGSASPTKMEWTDTGIWAELQTNGTLKLVQPA